MVNNHYALNQSCVRAVLYIQVTEPPAHLLLFRSGMLNSIGLCVCVLFFSICLIGLLLVGFDFHFCRDFLFLKKENKVG